MAPIPLVDKFSQVFGIHAVPERTVFDSARIVAVDATGEKPARDTIAAARIPLVSTDDDAAEPLTYADRSMERELIFVERLTQAVKCLSHYGARAEMGMPEGFTE